MIGMSTILSIRRRCADGDSVAEIAREEGVSEPTVRKYRGMEDFSPEARKAKKGQGVEARPLQGDHRLVARRRQEEARQAAPHGDQDLRPSRGGMRLRRRVHDRPKKREGEESPAQECEWAIP